MSLNLRESPKTLPNQEVDYPRRVYRGSEIVFSTSVALEPYPAIIWDTNGYYAALGVDPRATRLEIRQAYEAKQGWGSPRLTYIFKQLLDPEMRRRYDATPLGSVFLDYEVDTTLRLAKARQTSDDLLTGKVAFEDVVYQEDPLENLDSEGSLEDNGPTSPLDRGWEWDYYVWETRSRDIDRLRRWQEMLVRACAQRGGVLRLSVGLARSTVCRTVGGDVVAFLGDHDEPNEDLAGIISDHIATLTRLPWLPRF